MNNGLENLKTDSAKDTVITNPETIEAIEEVIRLSNSPVKLYTNLDEFWEDLLNDDED